jgi:lipoprotein-anchoring transpeptidase ErfK/SrfK
MLGVLVSASASAETAEGAAPPQAGTAAQSTDRLAAVTPAETVTPGAHQVSDAALPPAEEDKGANGTEAALLAPPEPTLFADIDLGKQEMVVSDKSGEIARWKISSARGGYTTPTGTYTVTSTDRMHYSRQYDWAPMPYAVFFKDGVAVHATNAVGNHGHPASHGCVRVHPANAKTFYHLVEKHGEQLTQITVHGTPPYSPVVAERARRRYQGYAPFGFFAAQPAYQPRRARQRYGGGYSAW